MTADAVAAPAAHRRVSVATLALVSMLSWGTLYYAYPVAAPRISEDTGWSTGLLAVVYSTSLVSAAVAGVWLGRITDRAGSLRRVMPWFSLLGCAGILLSTVGGLVPFVIGWALAGVAQAGTLWGPAFLAITRWFHGETGAWPMTVITAVGGSASLVFAPLVARLVDSIGWRETFVALAIGYAVLAIPAQLLGLRATWAGQDSTPGQSRGRVRAVAREPRFIALQLCMLIGGVALFSVTLNAVSLAVEKGASYTQAALVFGLIGLGQVLGRILFTSLPTGAASPWMQTRVLLVVAAAVLASIAAMPPVVPLAVVCVLAGAVRGSHTLLMRNGVLDRWGPGDFGAVMGWFNLPVALGIAASPMIGAGLASVTGSYTTAVLVAAGAALVGSVLARRT